jgi:hypothetical protein
VHLREITRGTYPPEDPPDTTLNPLRIGGLASYIDSTKPHIDSILFYRQGPNDTLLSGTLNGKVDILCVAGDTRTDTAGHAPIDTGNVSVYKIGYEIKDTLGNLLQSWEKIIFDTIPDPSNDAQLALTYGSDSEYDHFRYWVTNDPLNPVDSLRNSYWNTFQHADGQYWVKVIAKDIRGNEKEDSLKVTVDHPPRINDVSPDSGATEVLRNSQIGILFNENMDTTVNLNSAVNISPTIDGDWEWVTAQRAVFTPDSLFDRNETYTVTATIALRDLSGKGLDGDKDGITIWPFKTCPIGEGNDLFGYTADCIAYQWFGRDTAKFELGGDNDTTIAIGFNFPFYDIERGVIKISSNGYLTFPPEIGDEWVNRDIPNPTAPDYIIAPNWDDLWGLGGPPDRYMTFAHVLNEEEELDDSLVVTYNNWGFNLGWGDYRGVYNTFQVILESSGDIIYNYKHMDRTCTPYGPHSATVGVEKDGFSGLQVSFNDSSNYVPRDRRSIKITRGDPPCSDSSESGFGTMDTIITQIPPCGTGYLGHKDIVIICVETGETLFTFHQVFHKMQPCGGGGLLSPNQFPLSGFDVLLGTSLEVVMEIGSPGIEDTANLAGNVIIWRSDPDSITRIIQTEMVYMDMYGVTNSAIPVWILAGQGFGLPSSPGEIEPEDTTEGDFPAYSYFDVNFKFILQERIVEPIQIDVYPRTCPNTLPNGGEFNLPVAILGVTDTDVYTINPLSILLEGVMPTPTGINYVDTASTRIDTSNVCSCPSEWPDGAIDYLIEFNGDEILDALEEKYGSPLNEGDSLVLTLTGNYENGRPFEGRDCVIIVDSLGGPAGGNFDSRNPIVFALAQGIPNPFTGKTLIRYQLPHSVHVSLKVYDIAGRLVKTLVNEEKEAGYFRTHWDGKDNSGRRVASGVYFYRIKAGDYVKTRKMILLK